MGIRKELAGSTALAMAVILCFSWTPPPALAQSLSEANQASTAPDDFSFKEVNLNEEESQLGSAPTASVGSGVLQPLEVAVPQSASDFDSELSRFPKAGAAFQQIFAIAADRSNSQAFEGAPVGALTPRPPITVGGVMLQDVESNPVLAPTKATDLKGLQDLDVSVTLNKRELVTGAFVPPPTEAPVEPTKRGMGVGSEAVPPQVDVTAQRRRPTTATSSEGYRYSAGLDLPNFGWVKMKDRGIDSVLGINLGLGVSYKKYFTPAVSGKFNGSFGIGTLALIFPYASIGADYQWDTGWFAGGHIGGGVGYWDEEFRALPGGYISVGYRW